MTPRHRFLHRALWIGLVALAPIIALKVAPAPQAARAGEGLRSVAEVLAAGDAMRGEAAYEARCGGCHALDANRIGPAHRGVYGRKAGRAPEFDYSPALRNAAHVWDAATLDRWLTNPEAFVPGQRMGFSVGDPQIRADIIAYLKQESERPAPE